MAATPNDIDELVRAQAIIEEQIIHAQSQRRPMLITSTEYITPELAIEYLTHNHGNRPVKEKHVAELARLMQDGKWELNGESIIFDATGRLVDGQHRLFAVIEAERAISTVVVRGVSPTAFDTIDVGAKRSAAQILGLHGEKNANSLAAAARNLWRYEKNGWAVWIDLPSNRETLETIARHPGLRESVAHGLTICHLLQPSISGFLGYLFMQRDMEMARTFVDRLREGTDLAAHDPILELRKLLLNNKMQRKKFPFLHTCGLVIKAWNAYRSGAKIGRLWFRIGGQHPEEIPTIL